MIDTVQAVIQLANVSTRVIPPGVNGMMTRAGMLAMMTRVNGMRASPTISARAWVIVAGATGCGAIIMTLAPFCWYCPAAIPTLNVHDGVAVGSTGRCAEAGNKPDQCASMAYA
jgi:hypothetical protein